ncbi:MAG: CAP domain-containing protein [Cognatishimia sp.]|uniref:CAP domain-containing protein n=1 Tax=Cognatishimia sp. TaxID=2211648 RepID=UPI003B8C8AAA
MRLISALMAVLLVVSACTTSVPDQLGADGKPLPRLYRIKDKDTSKIQFRMVDSVNALRSASGLGAVELDSKLVAAAATHSRDMSIQNRPWHFGSDGSSPIDRVARVGYTGTLTGEAISETYETELQTLGAWMEDPGPRAVILDPNAKHMGFSWHQEGNGKIWWTLVMGAPASLAPAPAESFLDVAAAAIPQ